MTEEEFEAYCNELDQDTLGGQVKALHKRLLEDGSPRSIHMADQLQGSLDASRMAVIRRVIQSLPGASG